MQDIEPFYNWRYIYISEEDPLSPFFGRTYSEFEFSQTVYNYYIHPQWDDFGSRTLYLKVLIADYEEKYAVIEMIGEWNDAIENDIQTLRREVTDVLFYERITKFILIAENVLNFHSSDDSYYEEWFEEVESGWIAAVSFPDFVQDEMRKYRIDCYFNMGGTLQVEQWRTLQPQNFCDLVSKLIQRRLN